MTGNISFTALGGLNEYGKNTYVLKVNKSIYLFDAGSKQPEKGIYGVSTVIANFDYLIKNKNQIKGLFLSSCDDQSSEATINLLQKINLKIFVSEFGAFILKRKFKKLKLLHLLNNIIVLRPKQIINVGDYKIEVFRTISNFPGSFGYVIYTEAGGIVYSGNYIFTSEKTHDYSVDFKHLAQIAQRKILLLINSSSNATTTGFTAPNYQITPYINYVAREFKYRLIFSCFYDDFYKIIEFLNFISTSYKEEIGIYGRDLYDTLMFLKKQRNNYFRKMNFVLVENMTSFLKKVIIISESRKRLYPLLVNIALGEDKYLQINDDDNFILATQNIAGTELSRSNVLDELTRAECNITNISFKNLKTMSASEEDIKLLTTILKPKYVIPVSGFYKDFLATQKTLQEINYDSKQIIICENGIVAEFTKGFYNYKKQKQLKKIPCGDLYVDEADASDIASSILKERNQLSTDGVLIVGASLDSKTKKLASLIDIQFRGLVYVKSHNSLFNEIQDIAKILITKYMPTKNNDNVYDAYGLRNEMRKLIGAHIRENLGKNPLVLIVINEI